MRLLVVNAGSSSLKLSALDDADALVAERTIARLGRRRPSRSASSRPGSAPIDAVGHRVVHGGLDVHRAGRRRRRRDRRSCGELVAARAAASTACGRRDRAPRARAVPDATHVACFDTAFHATLPPRRARLRAARRRGASGGRCVASASTGSRTRTRRARVAELAGRAVGDLRVVTCHLGAGASLCAVRGGRSVDTTMGFTPLEGLVMATRAGSIDPGLVLWLDPSRAGSRRRRCSTASSSGSGLLGLAGTADMREVIERTARGDADAVLAFDVYVAPAAPRARRDARRARPRRCLSSSPAEWGSTRPRCAPRAVSSSIAAANARTTDDGEISARRRGDPHLRRDRARRPRDRAPGSRCCWR